MSARFFISKEGLDYCKKINKRGSLNFIDDDSKINMMNKYFSYDKIYMMI